MQHCNALWGFANRYGSPLFLQSSHHNSYLFLAQLQQTMPDICPTQQELADMSHRANEVVRLLGEYKRMNLPESQREKHETHPGVITPPDDHRPPKRPWEDTDQGDTEKEYLAPESDNKTTAEADMEIIRTKRATSTAGTQGTTGQQKSKYRKRSVCSVY
jgi:hypothetical protein